MKTLLVLILCALTLPTPGQIKCYVEHYDLNDGLPQRSVMSIMQDSKGFMWFGTWDGLCRFDGYNFRTFKTQQGDGVFMQNNRIDHICQDRYGYIWVYVYNRETFRFSPETEQYVATFGVAGKTFRSEKIIPTPSGKVWLTSLDAGALCVSDTLNNFSTYSVANGLLTSNKVYDAYEDSRKNSWLLTDDGLVRIIGTDSVERHFDGAFLCYAETEDELLFGCANGMVCRYNKSDGQYSMTATGLKSDVISISKVYDNLLIMLSREDGFILCDRKMNSLKHFSTSNLKGLPTNRMQTCFTDSKNNIWIKLTGMGIAKFNLLTGEMRYLSPPSAPEEVYPPPYIIAEDHAGRIWLQLSGLFLYYDEATERLMPFHVSEKNKTVSLHVLLNDNQGNMWISVRDGGVDKVVFDNSAFRLNEYYDYTGEQQPEARAFFEDGDGNIMVSAKDGLISVYDADKKKIGYLRQDGTIGFTGKPLSSVASYAFFEDSEGYLWIGTRGDGVYKIASAQNLNKVSNLVKVRPEVKVQHFTHTEDPYSLSNNNVYDFCEDSSGRIWIGTYGGGVNIYDKANERFIHSGNELKDYPVKDGSQIRCLMSRGDKVYAGATFGLLVMKLSDDNGLLFKFYNTAGEEGVSIKASDIFAVLNTKSDETWLAAFGGGLSKITDYDADGFPARFRRFDAAPVLHSDIVTSLAEDNNVFIWLNGENYLARFNPRTETFDVFNEVSRLLRNQYFSEAQPLMTSRGELIYGCSHGTLSFSPAGNLRTEYSPYLALVDFKVSNRDFPLQVKADSRTAVTLSHRENTFSIEFAALDYANPQSIVYAYKLDGFDEEWIQNPRQRIATYTNVPPGEYVFRVKSTDSNGAWADNVRSLAITVKPPFTKTKLAYIIYFLTVAALAYFILRSFYNYSMMKNRALLEQEQTEMKTRFFTDISHEIRTPLTMIVSPVENIIDSPSTPAELRPQLQLVLKNANRMLTMVNQILDFRKIQKKKLQLRETVLGQFIGDMYRDFRTVADSQGVLLRFSDISDRATAWIDSDSVEKLFFNLISNALKHTSKGKSIEISVFRKDKSLALQVRDEGQGMTKEVMNKLFTRFASLNADKSKPSTGIGLSIVREVAEKHRAKILVDSDLNKGSCFTVLFQSGTEHFANDPNAEFVCPAPADGDSDAVALSAGDAVSTGAGAARLSVLVTEDDAELRSFIKSVLEPAYLVFEAEDGNMGFECALSRLPDFIISDIMMPVSDGIDFLRKIRASDATSHIPFILLTAKTDINDRIEGVTMGADDFITKPFNVKLLIAKINNITEQRRRFACYLMGEKSQNAAVVDGDVSASNAITPQDEQFLMKIRDFIHRNIDDGEMTVDDVVAQTTYSRRLFYNKIKSLTSLAPVDFIREVRLRYAASLLQAQDCRIKEITYMVGFSDIRYFTKCFRELFGVTPSHYRSQFQNKQI